MGKCNCPQCVHVLRDKDGYPAKCGVDGKKLDDPSGTSCVFAEIDRRKEIK